MTILIAWMGKFYLVLFLLLQCLSLVLPNSSHGALRSIESSIRLEWVESTIAFRIHSPPWVRKCLIKWLNSLDRWPTVVLLLSMLRITMATVNLSVDQGHSSQLATISSIAAKDVHPLESPQRKKGEISELSMVLASLQIAPSRSFQ